MSPRNGCESVSCRPLASPEAEPPQRPGFELPRIVPLKLEAPPSRFHGSSRRGASRRSSAVREPGTGSTTAGEFWSLITAATASPQETRWSEVRSRLALKAALWAKNPIRSKQNDRRTLNQAIPKDLQTAFHVRRH